MKAILCDVCRHEITALPAFALAVAGDIELKRPPRDICSPECLRIFAAEVVLIERAAS